jgi:glycosyltransferase involved in cell wall biosynthesis
MATYNRSHLILESLVSLVNQTYDKWECIIIDDGSTDNTEEIINGFTDNDRRFKYFKRPNNHQKGLPGCRNYGLDIASGKYIIFFDDDDIVHPQNLEICLDILKHNDTDFCHYKKQSFTDELPQFSEIHKPIQKFSIGICDIEKVVTNKIALASCTVMWKKECFASIRFHESLSYAEEWDCYTRILLEGYNGTGIDEALYFNRKHPQSNTGEFWAGDEVRKASQIKAIKLVIANLKQKELLSRSLIRYFVQIGIFLKEISVINHVLETSNADFSTRLKFKMLYKFYPIIVLGHRTKKLLKKIRS